MSDPRPAGDGRGLLTSEGREQLVSASRRARSLDRDLAGRLRRPGPAGRPATSEYLERLEARPRLPQQLERELVQRAKAGDRHARGQLIEAFVPLIAAMARNYRSSSSIDRLDLLQEGALGLLRALDGYEPDRGVPFWGYASWWVREAMQRLVAELTRPVVLSDRALRHLARLKDAYRKLAQTGPSEPSVADLAHETGLSREQIENLLSARGPPPRSTSRPPATIPRWARCRR